jgi:hypothetical protein
MAFRLGRSSNRQIIQAPSMFNLDGLADLVR